MKKTILIIIFLIIFIIICFILLLHSNDDVNTVYKVEDNMQYCFSPFWLNENNVLFFELEKPHGQIAVNKINIETKKVENISILEGILKPISSQVIQFNRDKNILFLDMKPVPQLLIINKDNIYKYSLDIFNNSLFLNMSANGKYITGISMTNNSEIVLNIFNTEELKEKVINKFDNYKTPGAVVSILNNGDIIYQAQDNNIYIAKVQGDSLYDYRQIDIDIGGEKITNIFQSPDNSKVALLLHDNSWILAVIDVEDNNIDFYNLGEFNNKYTLDKPYVTWSSNNKKIILRYNEYEKNIIDKVQSGIFILDTISGSKKELLKYTGHEIGTISVSSINESIIYTVDGKKIKITDILGN